jgi:hypothetical protein
MIFIPLRLPLESSPTILKVLVNRRSRIGRATERDREPFYIETLL